MSGHHGDQGTAHDMLGTANRLASPDLGPGQVVHLGPMVCLDSGSLVRSRVYIRMIPWGPYTPYDHRITHIPLQLLIEMPLNTVLRGKVANWAITAW